MYNLNDYPNNVETLSLHSIVEFIERRSEYRVYDITKITAMCYDLDKTKQYLLVPGINEFISKIQLELYGFGNKTDYSDKNLANVVFNLVPQRLTDHFTVIELKGEPKFFWYETEHNLDRDRKIFGFIKIGKINFPDCGLLYALDNEKEAKEIYSKFKVF